MTMHTGIAEALRRAGLDVVEEPGWRVRGKATFNPGGVIFHHTASRPGRDAPSLGIVIRGRSDLPGPLCHVLISRSARCHVIAAGTANHAGSGGWKGLRFNSSVFGIEVENDGVGEPWTDTILDVTARASRALLDMVHRDESWLCGHKEWAPRRKIDPARINMDLFRERVANLTPGDDDVTPEDVEAIALTSAATTLKLLQEQGDTIRGLRVCEDWWDKAVKPAVGNWAGLGGHYDSSKLAAELADALAGAGAPVSKAVMEEALRNVLGSLDE